MAEGTIVVANTTDSPAVGYNIYGVGSGNTIQASGVVGNVPTGSTASGYPAQQTANVSGYDAYLVEFFSFIGDSSSTGYIQAKPGQTVTLGVHID